MKKIYGLLNSFNEYEPWDADDHIFLDDINKGIDLLNFWANGDYDGNYNLFNEHYEIQEIFVEDDFSLEEYIGYDYQGKYDIMELIEKMEKYEKNIIKIQEIL